MSDDKLQQALDEAREAKRKAVEAYQYAQRAESEIKHQMELQHLKLGNSVDKINTDVRLHRHVLATIATVIGLAVLGALLKAIGL